MEVINLGSSQGRPAPLAHASRSPSPGSRPLSPCTMRPSTPDWILGSAVPQQEAHVVHEIRPSKLPASPANFALSSHSPLHKASNGPTQLSKRPQSAPGSAVLKRSPKPTRLFTQHGKVSLFDHDHEYLGPKVLREWSPSIGTPPPSTDQYLKQGGGHDLGTRNNLAQWLKLHPMNREPPFQKGDAGVVLDRQSQPAPMTLFRHLYDLGSIDFVRVKTGGLQNCVEWGRRIRAGAMAWGSTPSEVSIAEWLPIFLEGIREYEEPYRVLAIRGSEALIIEAGSNLHSVAANAVPPLRKALESREVTAVAVALELILLSLKVDPQVAKVWVHQLWQWAQIMNLFVAKRFTVNLGYNSRQIRHVRQLVVDVLHLLEEHGGEHATALIRRYCRGVDPAVTPQSQARKADKERAKPGYQPWKPFTLF